MYFTTASTHTQGQAPGLGYAPLSGAGNRVMGTPDNIGPRPYAKLFDPFGVEGNAL